MSDVFEANVKTLRQDRAEGMKRVLKNSNSLRV